MEVIDNFVSSAGLDAFASEWSALVALADSIGSVPQNLWGAHLNTLWTWRALDVLRNTFARRCGTEDLIAGIDAPLCFKGRTGAAVRCSVCGGRDALMQALRSVGGPALDRLTSTVISESESIEWMGWLNVSESSTLWFVPNAHTSAGSFALLLATKSEDRRVTFGTDTTCARCLSLQSIEVPSGALVVMPAGTWIGEPRRGCTTWVPLCLFPAWLDPHGASERLCSYFTGFSPSLDSFGNARQRVRGLSKPGSTSTTTLAVPEPTALHNEAVETPRLPDIAAVHAATLNAAAPLLARTETVHAEARGREWTVTENTSTIVEVDAPTDAETTLVCEHYHPPTLNDRAWRVLLGYNAAEWCGARGHHGSPSRLVHISRMIKDVVLKTSHMDATQFCVPELLRGSQLQNVSRDAHVALRVEYIRQTRLATDADATLPTTTPSNRRATRQPTLRLVAGDVRLRPKTATDTPAYQPTNDLRLPDAGLPWWAWAQLNTPELASNELAVYARRVVQLDHAPTSVVMKTESGWKAVAFPCGINVVVALGAGDVSELVDTLQPSYVHNIATDETPSQFLAQTLPIIMQRHALSSRRRPLLLTCRDGAVTSSTSFALVAVICAIDPAMFIAINEEVAGCCGALVGIMVSMAPADRAWLNTARYTGAAIVARLRGPRCNLGALSLDQWERVTTRRNASIRVCDAAKRMVASSVAANRDPRVQEEWKTAQVDIAPILQPVIAKKRSTPELRMADRKRRQLLNTIDLVCQLGRKWTVEDLPDDADDVQCF